MITNRWRCCRAASRDARQGKVTSVEVTTKDKTLNQGLCLKLTSTRTRVRTYCTCKFQPSVQLSSSTQISTSWRSQAGLVEMRSGHM